MVQLFDNDKRVRYKDTTVDPMRSRMQITKLLNDWDIRDVGWHWYPERNDVYVLFILEEEIEGVLRPVTVKVEAPPIWKHPPRYGSAPKAEINYKISLRVMHWYIKSHLEMSVYSRSSKVRQFLQYIMTGNGKVLSDVVLRQLDSVHALKALPKDVTPNKIEIIPPVE